MIETSGISAARFSAVRFGRAADVVQNLISFALQRRASEIGRLIPDFNKLIGKGQNTPYHALTMEAHTFEFVARLSADPAVEPKLSEEVILAALLHDIGKPASETITPEGKSQYLGHDKKGAEIAKGILTSLGIDSAAQETILKLIEFHMRPVEIINQIAAGTLTDKALSKFLKDAEPLQKLGINMDMILAFGRADIIASQGPECFAKAGAVLGDINNLVAKVDDLVKQTKERIAEYNQKLKVEQEKAQASKPKTVTSQDLMKAGFKPGPNFATILKTAAELERTDNLAGEQLIAKLKEQFPV